MDCETVRLWMVRWAGWLCLSPAPVDGGLGWMTLLALQACAAQRLFRPACKRLCTASMHAISSSRPSGKHPPPISMACVPTDLRFPAFVPAQIKNSAESENLNWILANTKPCPKCT